MAPKFDFESYFFNPFLVNDNLIHKDVDPNVNSFQGISFFDFEKLLSPEVKESFKKSSEEAISIFHVNNRSMNEQEL